MNIETNKVAPMDKRAFKSLVLFIPLIVPILVVQSILESAFRNAAKTGVEPSEALRIFSAVWRWTEWFWPVGVMLTCFIGCWFAAKSKRFGLRELSWFAIVLSVLALLRASLTYWWVDRVIHS